MIIQPMCEEPSENADVTGLYCEGAPGHRGDHWATTAITWPASEVSDD